ncbi:hypothetical protein PIB30_069173 [Stylosanthes scabra]|uniref:Uncharacterized protein n=1 Tax=Stylosanthes scabra TaxID=79078 RepID=A0ABU6SN67_9FABA|nr:hypothetical protein [Stylosanthes scabra]
MGKKKSCQELKIPRPLDAIETRLYGWVEEAVLTQPFVVESDSLPEFHLNYPLMEDSGAEGDYVLEAARPSDRVPFRAGEEGPHVLWIYQELFTRLRMRISFSDFQRDVMTRCRVAVSQLHLNGWDFILTFEKVCLHYGQGRKLFNSYDDSIQEFKWHYFKVLAASGKRAFWLDHENKPFSWVYWNPKVKDFTLHNLEPLEMAAFKFLVSLPSGLPKRNKFIYDLLDIKMKKTKLDDLMARMADPSRMGPRAVLPTGRPSATATAAIAAAATSASAAVGPTPVESSTQVPPASATSETHRTKKQSSKRDRAKVMNLEGEEGLQEDPAADLQQKRRKKKAKVDEAFEKALGDDSAWEHEVDPLKVAFLEGFKFRKALNAGLTSVPVRETLTKMPPEQLLGESYHLHAKSLACFQEKADTLKDELSEKSLEHKSALDWIAQLEEDNRVLKTQFESSQLSLEVERKRAAAAEKQVWSLAASLKNCQADLSKATKASEYWRSEWRTLGNEGKRIFVPQESDEGEPSRVAEAVLEQRPEPTIQASQSAAGDAAGLSTG